MAKESLVWLANPPWLESIKSGGSLTVRTHVCLGRECQRLALTFRLGQLLAVAFSNHFIYLTNAHTGKLMHQIDCSAHSGSHICCLGWGVNFADIVGVRTQAEKVGGEVNLDDLLSQTANVNGSQISPDLPRDLAFLDVERTLPRLSSLSSGGKE